jgi:hypothetical protein
MRFKQDNSPIMGLAFIAKWLLIISLAVMAFAYIKKDDLPDPKEYLSQKLDEPVQYKTDKKPFLTQVNEQKYAIKPLFEYELEGVVVSYHDAAAVGDIWHHDKWLDFLNVRDLCVIWGANVRNGVYQDMDFKNDSWTCWASWPDRETGARFSMTKLSNNHLLADSVGVKEALMSAEPGDVVRLKGVLAEYANPANGFIRGSSTNRNDRGNGACETIYLNDFRVVHKANEGMRTLYSVSKWMAIFSFIVFALFFLFSPARR